MNWKPIDGAEELPGRRFNGCASFWKRTGQELAFLANRNFETEGEAIELGLRRTIEGWDTVMRILIRTVYRFREATLIAEKKDDFGNALQNLYRE
jgi:hypothetical protein